MNIVRDLDKLCKTCIKHFDEISEEKDKIYAFSIELASQSIWGGNGDRDTDKKFYITKDGWVAQTITLEFGMYGENILQDETKRITSEEIEKDLNGENAKMHEVETLFKFYHEIRTRYTEDFK